MHTYTYLYMHPFLRGAFVVVIVW